MALKCTECGQVFDKNLDACPNCGNPASECETIVETKATTTSNPSQVCSQKPYIFEVDWANKIYECGVLYWDTLTKRYLRFSGRASRLEYWTFLIISCWIVYPIYCADGGIRDLSIIPLLYLLIPMLSVSVRRFHDINRSGWWILVPYISIFMSFKKSDEGENKYGLPSDIKLQ